MRRLVLIGATAAAALALGGTALAASSPASPSQVVVTESATPEDNPSRGVDDDPAPYETAPTGATASPSAGATVDDHGGLRTTEPGDDHGRGGDGSDDPPGDDHGGRGHGGDDRSGDDHGGSRHRR